MPEETKTEEVVEETKTEEVKEQEPEEEESSEEVSEEKKEETKVSDEEIALIQLLKNPKTRRQTLQALMQSEGETKGTGLEADLRELMGDEFDLIPKSTFKAMDRLIQERLKGLEERIEGGEQRRIARESEAAQSKLFRIHPDAKPLESEIVKLINEYPATGDKPVYAYLEDMYRLAKARKGQSAVEQERRKRIEANKGDASLKHSEVEGVRKGNKVSLEDAVRIAANKLSKS